ncbi:unnamed protein product [Amoebophrya sp. A120]|nr:unnamed protein product [Amoebophrya sp. A120]|eukprot:GSA120T00015124001.1
MKLWLHLLPTSSLLLTLFTAQSVATLADLLQRERGDTTKSGALREKMQKQGQRERPTSNSIPDWGVGMFQYFRPTISWVEYTVPVESFAALVATTSKEGQGHSGPKIVFDSDLDDALLSPAVKANTNHPDAHSSMTLLQAGTNGEKNTDGENKLSSAITIGDQNEEQQQHRAITKNKIENYLALRVQFADAVAQHRLRDLPPGSLYAFPVRNFRELATAHRFVELTSAAKDSVGSHMNPAKDDHGMQAFACWLTRAADGKGGCVVELRAEAEKMEGHLKNGLSDAEPSIGSA